MDANKTGELLEDAAVDVIEDINRCIRAGDGPTQPYERFDGGAAISRWHGKSSLPDDKRRRGSDEPR